MSNHIEALRLEALAAGDEDAEAAEHVDGCVACRGYVDQLRTASEHFHRSAPNRDAFLGGLERRGEDEVRPLPARDPRVRWVRWSPLLAVAAAAALWIGITEAPSRSPSRELPATDSPDMRAKGSVGLAVIRERDGQQERLTGRVAVRPFDRLRAEVQVGTASPLRVVFIGDDGTFIELMSSARVEPGEHYAKTAVHMDEHPTAGRIVAGTRDAVERARREGRFEGVTSLKVEVEH